VVLVASDHAQVIEQRWRDDRGDGNGSVRCTFASRTVGSIAESVHLNNLQVMHKLTVSSLDWDDAKQFVDVESNSALD